MVCERQKYGITGILCGEMANQNQDNGASPIVAAFPGMRQQSICFYAEGVREFQPRVTPWDKGLACESEKP